MLQSLLGGAGMGGVKKEVSTLDTSETVIISSLALIKMLKHGESSYAEHSSRCGLRTLVQGAAQTPGMVHAEARRCCLAWGLRAGKGCAGLGAARAWSFLKAAGACKLCFPAGRTALG